MEQLRATLGAAVQPHQAIAMFDVGDRTCYLLISEGNQGHPAPVIHYMHLGLHLLTQRTFKKSMPTATQMETAIMVVEDAVMPLARLVPPHSVLATRDPLLLRIARDAAGDATLGTTPLGEGEAPPSVSRDAIEALFNEVVNQITGASRSYRTDIPQEPRWIAALVLLREVLHHWQFPIMRLLPASHDTPAR